MRSGSKFRHCNLGHDCEDCGTRLIQDVCVDGSVEMCHDDCSFASDGVCDDGGPNADYDVCSFGSDCADCGIRYDADADGFYDDEGGTPLNASLIMKSDS